MASTQTRQKRKATLRECSFLCGPIHRKIEVLAAAVAFARCSLGIIFTCNKCATESQVNKPVNELVFVLFEYVRGRSMQGLQEMASYGQKGSRII